MTRPGGRRYSNMWMEKLERAAHNHEEWRKLLKEAHPGL
jgi:hypothetical protein